MRPPLRFRRTGIAAAAALALLAMLPACGDDDQGKATGAELTMFAWSSSPAEDGALRKLVDDYTKLGRNKVKLSILPEYDPALTNALAGGKPPDVFYLNDNKVPDMVKNGVLEPVGDKVDNPADFHQSLRESFTVKGQFYCPPKDFSTLQLVYNTEELQKASVKPPATWDELAAAAKALAKPGRPGLVMNPEFFRWAPFFTQAGAWITNDDVTKMTMDTPQVRQTLQYIADLHKQGAFASAPSVGAGWGGEALGKGIAAMTIEGNWIAGAMEKDFPNVKYAVAELPAGPKGKGTVAFSACYAVPKASKNKAAAIDFVRFLTSPEQQLAATKAFAVMPSRKSLSEPWLADKPQLKAFVAGVEYARKAVFAPGFQTVLDTLNEGIQGLAKGDKTVDQVVSSTQKAGTDVLGG